MIKKMKYTFVLTALTLVFVTGCKKKDVAPPPTIPLVTTAVLTNAGNGNYTTGGSIVSDGGATVTQSGIVWSKTNNTPTLTDSVVAGTTTTGAFTTNISNIAFNTTYYFRAFATNSVGTGYGNVISLTTSNDSVRFTYNGQSVTYGIIVSPTTGKKWLDRNIGAKRQATAFDDYQAYGDLFQWGRPADAHQLINWTSSTAGAPVNGMTTTIAISDIPGHNNFIDGTAAVTPSGDPSRDWRSDNNRNRWTTIPQGPCPAGWHVPTIDEWMAEVSNTGGFGGTATSGGVTNYNTGYSLLKLTVGGRRNSNGSTAGQLAAVGNVGFYWSTSDQLNLDNYTWIKDFEFGASYAQRSFQNKALGACVRCIKD